MAIIKCKMCGGDLVLEPETTVAECEYCGTMQTVPLADNEKKLTLFARANRLRAACEFDKAAGIYEAIVADFPEEAEAYWGLVLCKYGIEYVDDPGTGKKIPTCHRSSFDSVMEDSNFEQAEENADPVARKIYRQEAKTIEEIRKRIIEVSSKEDPYDIFICYKETDENGERTLDSVLAQDLYDMLTAKGYRVFFARITLEDKLGQEYEPYIFAALNSAKLMLVIGTEYDHFNAVWVKNEWSRFLQIITNDRSKHLIPCFKGIDAYDIPKEFNKLQAQDLSKVGADQDLMRGIEKLLPKQPASAAGANGSVSATLGPNLASLIRRAETFVEDAEWKNAEKYYDNILDTNPECAAAYMGKSLIQQKAVSLDVLVNQRLEKYSKDIRTTDNAQRDTEREDQLVKTYALGRYLTEEQLRELMKCDMQYTSTAGSWDKHLAAEKQFFASDRYMGRALRFATGTTKMKLEAAKKKALDALENKLVEAQKSGEEQRRLVMERYEQTMQEAEATARRMYDQGQNAINSDLQRLVQGMQTANTSAAMKDVLAELKIIHKIRPIDELVRASEQKTNYLLERERQEKELNEQIRLAHQTALETDPQLELLKERQKKAQAEQERLKRYSYGPKYSFGYNFKWHFGMLIRMAFAIIVLGFVSAVFIQGYFSTDSWFAVKDLIHDKSFVWTAVITLLITWLILRGLYKKEREKAGKMQLLYWEKELKFLSAEQQKREEELTLENFRSMYIRQLQQPDSTLQEAETKKAMKKLKGKLRGFRFRHGRYRSKGILRFLIRLLVAVVLGFFLGILFIYDMTGMNLLLRIPVDKIPDWIPREWLFLDWMPKGWARDLFN